MRAGGGDAYAGHRDCGGIDGEHAGSGEPGQQLVGGAHDSLTGGGRQPATDIRGEVDQRVFDDGQSGQGAGDCEDLVAEQEPSGTARTANRVV